MDSPGGDAGVWVELTDGANSTQIPVGDVGGRIRLAVGEPGRRSSVWTIEAKKAASGKSDIYFSSQTVMGSQKFSLHESGDWRYAYTNVFMHGAAATGIVDRVIDQWRRPEPDAAGWVRAVTVWVRSEDVTPVDDSTIAKWGDIVWIPAPDVGQLVGIHLAYVVPDRGYVELKGTPIVAVVALANRNALFVLTSTRTADAAEVQQLAAWRALAVGRVPPELSDRQGEPGLRMGIYGSSPGGERLVWDTAF